ncbi:RNA ligase [Pelomyxa schiedti]|nr:RNA ligase [Pelomyxa schiedti]
MSAVEADEEHQEYEKMSETTSGWLSVAKLKGAWVVTEKAHGANFCFVCSTAGVKVAKRSSFLKTNEDFFGFQEVQNKYQQNALDLFAKLHREDPTISKVSIFGELIGGGYVEHGTPLTPEQMNNLVQSEIFYCPNHEFYAFDITTAREPSMTREYLPYDVAMALFEEFRFFYATPLFIGPLEKALAYNVDFITTIPGRLGLPPLRNNKAEGVVIKPHKRVVYVDTNKGEVRAIVKKKAHQFCECVAKSSKSQHSYARERHAATTGTSADPNDWVAIEETLTRLEEQLLQYVNQARLNSVLSKSGRHLSAQDLAQLLVKDALTQAKEDDPNLGATMDSVPAQQRPRLTAAVAAVAVDLAKRALS